MMTSNNPIKNLSSRTIEAIKAKRYSSRKYTFDQAYKDARSKGQRTFFWNGKYYNTDYEGAHGKQYREDVKSGKAAAWETKYPGFTNPELRKEKQEELNTYGITNEQTKNKGRKDILLRRIPARGYDVNEAISGILGEHNTFSQYDTEEELISALRKKYPQFKDVPLKSGLVDKVGGGKGMYLESIDKYEMPKNADPVLWNAFINDVNNFSRLSGMFDRPEEIHRPELDYLLGYPITKNKANGAVPIISKYRTGKDPYYYTTSQIELSQPFVPQRFLDIRDARNREEEYIDNLESSIYRPNEAALPKDHSYDDLIKAFEKDEALPENRKKINIIHNYREKNNENYENFIDKYYSSDEYKNKWDNIGVSVYKGDLNFDYPRIINSEPSSRNIDTLAFLGAFDHVKPLQLTPGNHLASSGYADYYRYDTDSDVHKGKYQKIVDKINNSKEDHNKYTRESLNTSDWMYSDPTLGVYTLGVPKDTSYVSVWDKFDINPFGSGNDKPIIQVGKPFEYYTRFYPQDKKPDIDKLYKDFSYKKGGLVKSLM